MFGWNANQYQKFEAQRTLPAMDLARAIPLSMVKSCLDVGCGIGNSTAVLQQQFPEAQILGVDSSENMLQTAKNEHPQAEYQLLDAGTELPRLNRTFDVVFSNACIQWIPPAESNVKRYDGAFESEWGIGSASSAAGKTSRTADFAADGKIRTVARKIAG